MVSSPTCFILLSICELIIMSYVYIRYFLLQTYIGTKCCPPMLAFVHNEQSNCTSRCSQEVSAAGLPWLEHFRVQCYTQVKSLLVGFRKTKFTATQLQDLKQKPLEFRVLWLLKKALPSREEPDISLSIVNSKARLHRLYTRALRAQYQPEVWWRAQYTQFYTYLY